MTTTTAQHRAIAALCEARTAVEVARREAVEHYAFAEPAGEPETWVLIREFGSALDQVDAALRTATDALPDLPPASIDCADDCPGSSSCVCGDGA